MSTSSPKNYHVENHHKNVSKIILVWIVDQTIITLQ